MKRSITRTSLALTTSLLSTLPAYAEFENKPFSAFGAFGLEYVNYSEHLSNFGGQEVDSSFDAINLVQRSGGYTAATDKLGFFINSASTLIANEANEEWEASGIQGYIQEDTAAMNFQTLDIMLAFHMQTGTYITAGMHYQKISFSRFDWRTASGTEAFADSIDTYIRETPSVLNPIIDKINNNGFVDGAGNPITTLDQYLEATRFEPEETQEVVFEDAVSFGFMMGVGYDSYFIRPGRGFRFMGEAALGTQLYENVLNSTEARSLTRSFGGGIDAMAKLGAGYQFSRRLGLMLGLDAHYSYRNEIREQVSSTKLVTLPENTFYSLASYVSVTWNFK